MRKRNALENPNIVPKKRKKNDYHRDYKNTPGPEPVYHEDESMKTPNNEQFECDDESLHPEFQLSENLVYNTIITDLNQKQWRIGIPIGKGSFGEIFLASDNTVSSITKENAKYVVKIEPHSNGPLFVEIHCLLNTAKPSDDEPLPPGMPEYIASGSHYFGNIRYRFLILPRFTRDLHSIIKNRRVDKKSVLILAVQILEILQHIHNKGYCHSDIKAENLMVGKCQYHNSSFQNEQNNLTRRRNKNNYKSDNKYYEWSYSDKCQSNEIEDAEDESDSEDSDSCYRTPNTNKKIMLSIQYSGSNPVRSCRNNQPSNSMYQEMINSHYLRPAKKINYSSFFDDDNSNSSGEKSVSIDQYISNHRLSKSAAENRKSIHLNTEAEENRIYLIDFGLASKFIDTLGIHRPFCMDQRRAHDGTLEFTSRDAHMGAHSRRSDLECLGYNLIFWSQGYLPWKGNAAQLQHEKVHWMKEYFMTDVKEMLKNIYGKKVPKFLGEFMSYVGKLAYDERPDYAKCQKIFQREYLKLNPDKLPMKLNVQELIQNSVHINDEIENNNLCELKNIKSIMKNLGVLMPFRESNGNRVSPKNLRSKSSKTSTKKKRKFSWADIMSQDADQIARDRAEKEFEREQTIETPMIRFKGKPTYAILEIQNKLKFKDKLNTTAEDDINDYYEFNTKGYTKPMIDILKKRQLAEIAEVEAKKKLNFDSVARNTHAINKKTSKVSNCPDTAKRTRAKEGLRTTLIQTKRAVDYNLYLVTQKSKRAQNRYTDKVMTNVGDTSNMSNYCRNQHLSEIDDNSFSSMNSIDSSNNNCRSISNSSKKSTSSTATTISSTKELHQYRVPENSNSNSSGMTVTSGGGATSSSFPASLSDEDTRDVMVAFNPKKTRQTVKKLKIKINGPTAAIIKERTSSPQGARRRKKTVPKKRN